MNCPHCKSELELRYKKNLINKDLKKKWFYTQFLKCPNCDYILLDNKYRIIVEINKKQLINNILMEKGA
jgi:uncharacterized protein with PIN domain